MDLSEYQPRSMLVNKETKVLKSRFPVWDAHNHLGDLFGNGWFHHPVSELLDALDEAGIETVIDLDGGWGEDILQAHLDHYKAAAPSRFQVFGGVDWSRWPELGARFPAWAAGRLRQQAVWGAQGLKIWKPLGLHVVDERGSRVSICDPRLDPLWESAAELNLPVVIHIADPAAFFDPLDHTNERWEELQANPDWHFPSPPFPSFNSLLNGLAGLVSRHPRTTFVGAHVGCYAENLAWVGSLLDRCPNFNVDIAARLAELGRQPYSARRFFLRYASRILFGTDISPDLGAYRLHYRFLETDDEYFPYDLNPIPGQGRWRIYGLYLPADVLEKVYCLNARRIFGGQPGEGQA